MMAVNKNARKEKNPRQSSRQSDFVATCEKLVKYLDRKAQHAQISVYNATESSVEVTDNEVSSSKSTETAGATITAWVGGRRGSISTTRPDRAAADAAVRLARANKKLEYFYGLPERLPMKRVDVYDNKVARLDSERLIDIAEGMIHHISFTKNSKVKVSMTDGEVSAGVQSSVLLNSNGVNCRADETFFSLNAGTVARAKMVSSCADYASSHFLFDTSDFCATLHEKTLDFLSAEKIKPVMRDYDFLLSRETLSSLLEAAFLSNLSGKNVEKGTSIFAGRLGETVCSRHISLEDDGLYPRGIYSSPFDFEGYPSQKTALIEKGVLSGFIYDFNTARHAGKKPTGNGTVNGPGFSNIVFKTNGEVFKEQALDRAILIDSIIGAHTSNSLTTEFSVRAEQVYCIKKGEKIPLRGAMFSGKVTDILANLLASDGQIKNRGRFYLPRILVASKAGSLV